MDRKSIYTNIIDIFNNTNTESVTAQRGFNYRLLGTKNSESLRLVDDNNKNRNVEFYANRGALYITYTRYSELERPYPFQSALVNNEYFSGTGYTVKITINDMVTKIIKNGLHMALNELEEMA